MTFDIIGLYSPGRGYCPRALYKPRKRPYNRSTGRGCISDNVQGHGGCIGPSRGCNEGMKKAGVLSPAKQFDFTTPRAARPMCYQAFPFGGVDHRQLVKRRSLGRHVITISITG